MADLGVIRRGLMPIRREWNRQGPPVPRWFELKLKRIDPRLVLQYMPPKDPVDAGQGNGVDERMYPKGVWAVCRRLPRTGYLLKQWVFCCTDPETKEHRFTHTLLRAIKTCRNAARLGTMKSVLKRLDRACQQVLRVPDGERAFWAAQVANTCREHEITNASLGRPQVRVLGD